MLSWNQDQKRKQKSIATGVSVNGNNKRKAEAVRKQILEEWEEKVVENFKDILFSDYIMHWLEIYKEAIAETTYFSYKATIEKQIVPYFAERKIKRYDLKPYHIQAFYKWKMDEGGVSGNTIHHYHANIHKALKDAVKTEIINDNPASKVTLPKKKKFIQDFYVAEEMRVLLGAIIGTKLETPVFLASWLGLSRGEIVGLRWQDVNFESMTLSVRGVVTDKGTGSRTENLKYRDGVAKSESRLRSFPLEPEVVDYLKALQKRQNENRCLFGSMYINKWSDFICVDFNGDLIKPEYISRTFPTFLQKNGLRKIRFHELRDSNASLLLDMGVDMKRIQAWLGHDHYSTTDRHYAHLRTDAKTI